MRLNHKMSSLGHLVIDTMARMDKFSSSACKGPCVDPKILILFYFYWAQIKNSIAKRTQYTTSPAETTQPK